MKLMSIKRIAAISVFLVSAVTVSAQEADSLFPEFSPDVDMKSSVPENSFSNRGIQFGGWTVPVYFSDSSSDSSTFANTLRLWGRAWLWENSSIYIRGKYTYTRTDAGEVESDNIIDLDLGYLQAGFADNALRFSAGRKYFTLGNGFILNGRGDGGEIELTGRIADVKLLASYTGLLKKDDNPYNLSSKDYSDGAKRLFTGGSISHTIFNQTIYLMGLYQKDYADETEVSKRYDSQYYGAGLKGVFPAGIMYYGEIFIEKGSTFSYSSVGNNLTVNEEDIDAMAAVAGINWNIGSVFKPQLILQYSYGSADSDRTDYSTPYGNTASTDGGFIPFGTYLAGYGLRPQIGNMHVFRAGISFAPLDMSQSVFLNRMTVIAKYSYYLKADKDAAVDTGYGAEQVPGEAFVGHGIDAGLRWRIFSDLALFANYGVFLPGEAFASEAEKNHFFMSGMNLGF